MRKVSLFIYLFILIISSSFASTPSKLVGGIGGQAVFDSTAQRFTIISTQKH